MSQRRQREFLATLRAFNTACKARDWDAAAFLLVVLTYDIEQFCRKKK